MRVRQLRKESGLTQSELGERLGWTQSVVSEVESATRNLSIEQVAKLADALGVDVQDLFKRKRTRTRRGS
jgi:transcriptional regulator with XRE-family HTH domain